MDNREEAQSERKQTGWIPKTGVGKDVAAGKYSSLDQLFEAGIKIREAEIIDHFLPNLKNDVILIGGSGGKGGGIRRTPSKRTARMHKSGRRFRVSVMVVIGNEDGYIGYGLAGGPPGMHREAVNKAIRIAKLAIFPMRLGCGSWECGCKSPHSIPFSVTGKAGSVRMKLIPAPKGLGLAVNDEVKKILKLAGIHDIWSKSEGQTASRINMVMAVVKALNNLNRYRLRDEFRASAGVKGM